MASENFERAAAAADHWSSMEFLTVVVFSADEKWASAIATTMIERKTITQPELDAELGLETEEPPVK